MLWCLSLRDQKANNFYYNSAKKQKYSKMMTKYSEITIKLFYCWQNILRYQWSYLTAWKCDLMFILMKFWYCRHKFSNLCMNSLHELRWKKESNIPSTNDFVFNSYSWTKWFIRETIRLRQLVRLNINMANAVKPIICIQKSLWLCYNFAIGKQNQVFLFIGIIPQRKELT